MSREPISSKLQEGLYTKRFGRSIVLLRQVNSTNEVAKQLAMYGAAEGTFVVSEVQTNGYGRRGRRWFSPKGGLWLSVILRPRLKANDAARLVFVAGLAVVETLRELYNVAPETKWPNDILLDRRKVAGILSEMSTRNKKVRYVIIGIGINANIKVAQALPVELWKTATSLRDELGKKVELDRLFRSLVVRLEKIYDRFLEDGFDRTLRKWKKYASFIGQKVQATDAEEKVEGLAIDVDCEGALVIQLESGELKRVTSGDVSFIFS